MAKPFDYSKWDKIELSDDEEDCHPNIDKESWFRMKHRSRVEREENEEKDKARMKAEIEKNNQRIKQLQFDLKKLDQMKANDSDDDDDDIDLDDRNTLQTELDELMKINLQHENKLQEYEKNRKLNIDNMFEVKEERTMINPNAGKQNYTPSGFAIDKVAELQEKLTISNNDNNEEQEQDIDKKPSATTNNKKEESSAGKPAAAPATTTLKKLKSAPVASSNPTAGPAKPSSRDIANKPNFDDTNKKDLGSFETYHQFTERHADTVEEFMALETLEESKQFLLKYGDVLLQENACNYLLLASLEDEMNGYREKMKRTARQSQLITNIAELAKTLKTHPGNVIMPFFTRLEQREPLQEFISGVNSFVDKIIKRAVVKKAEIDEERRKEEGVTSLEDIPKEQRLGPGGLDPLEVIPTLPQEMQDAFESRDVDQLRTVLAQMDPKDAEYHMKRCIDSGLWNVG